MTIEVEVINRDSRANAVISVKAISVATGEPESGAPVATLKGGESCKKYVHNGQRLSVEEVSNG